MEYGKDYFGFVYIWYNRVALEMEKIDYKNRHASVKKKEHPRLYIGYHMGPYNDGYICSSSWMLSSYKRNPQNFMRRILYYHPVNNKKLLIEVEAKWLNLIKEEELGKRFYNLSRGIWKLKRPKKEKIVKQPKIKIEKNMSDIMKEYYKTEAGKQTIQKIKEKRGQQIMAPHSEKTKEKQRQKAIGRKHTDETKAIIKEKRSKQVITEEHKKNISLGGKGKKHNYPKHISRDCNRYKITPTRSWKMLNNNQNILNMINN